MNQSGFNVPCPPGAGRLVSEPGDGRRLCDAIRCLHSLDIAHCDLSLEPHGDNRVALGGSRRAEPSRGDTDVARQEVTHDGPPFLADEARVVPKEGRENVNVVELNLDTARATTQIWTWFGDFLQMVTCWTTPLFSHWMSRNYNAQVNWQVLGSMDQPVSHLIQPRTTPMALPMNMTPKGPQ